MKNRNKEEPPKILTPKRIVNFIFGGEEVTKVTFTTINKFTKMSIFDEKRMRQTLPRESIIFDDKDVDGVHTS